MSRRSQRLASSHEDSALDPALSHQQGPSASMQIPYGSHPSSSQSDISLQQYLGPPENSWDTNYGNPSVPVFNFPPQSHPYFNTGPRTPPPAQSWFPPSNVGWPPFWPSQQQPLPPFTQQAPFRPPMLNEATGAVVNSPESSDKRAAPRGQKRAAPAAPRGRGPKRARVTASTAGVGPRSQPVAPPPPPPRSPSPIRTTYQSLTREPKAQKKAPATDVYYFMRALDSTERPTVIPTEPLFRNKPKSAYLGCRLCVDEWKTFKNTDGMTGAIREHLIRYHFDIWRQGVLTEKLKNWEQLVPGSTAPEPHDPNMRQPFCLERFYELLMRWVVVDDQSSRVVDCPELRELLLYLGQQLRDEELPHRTKLDELIVKSYLERYKTMLDELENAEGRISTTADVWTDNARRPYLAITGHFIVATDSDELELRSRLLAFKYLPDHHTGEHMANVVFTICKELNVLHNLGSFTLDNAENNGTMMKELEELLCAEGIPYDRDGNRIRCFPHVINIAVQRGLAFLTKLPEDWDLIDAELDLDSLEHATAQLLDALDKPTYREALESDPVARCRRLVVACRASGLRRKCFKETIREGNQAGNWDLRVLELLRDVTTRWSATYIMIDRVLELYNAVEAFLNRSDQRDISDHRFTNAQLEVLSDIRRFLQPFHLVQELLSAEKTPTLAMVLPAYERLLQILKKLRGSMPQLAHAINASIGKIEEYVALSRQSRVFALSMAINPTSKFEWMDKHWTADEAAKAKAWLHDAALPFYTAARHERSRTNSTATSTPAAVPPEHPPPEARGHGAPLAQQTGAQHAARAQHTGLARLANLERSLSVSGLPTSGPTVPAPPSPPIDPQVAEVRALEADRRAVEDEIHRYVEEGIVADAALEHFDLLRFWKDARQRFPSLYRVAMDVLPVQASAVPCERVFSSAKQSVTELRNRLLPESVEVLQVLKFQWREDRLDFCSDWFVSAEELENLQIVPSIEFESLLVAGKINELNGLCARSP